MNQDGADIRLEPVSKNRTVLVVDDEPAVRELYGKSLASAGYAVLTAQDSVTGMSQAVVHRPDLLLVDVHIPGKNGFELVRSIRDGGEWGASVPVIYLTNDTGETDGANKEIQETTPAYYLVKSRIDLAEVIAKIGEVLGV